MSDSARLVLLLAGNTIRELVRSKLLYNLLLFAVLLIGASMFVAQLTIGQWDRVILDLGLASIELAGVLIAVLIGVSLLAGEIERRTIYPTLAKPLGRATFVLGRWLGLNAILMLDALLMLAALSLVLRMAGYELTPVTLQAVLLILLELCLMSALALVFASFSTPILASSFALAFFLIGHLVSDLKAFAQRSGAGFGKNAALAAYRLLPDLELLNLKPQAASQLAVSGASVAWAAAYALLYTAVLLGLAVVLFQRRDLK